MPFLEAADVRTAPAMLVVNPGQDIRDQLEEALQKAFRGQAAHSVYSRPMRPEHPRLAVQKKPRFEMIMIDTVSLGEPSLMRHDFIPNWLSSDILNHAGDACVVLLVPDNPDATALIRRAFRDFTEESLSREGVRTQMEDFIEEIKRIWDQDRVSRSSVSPFDI